MNRRKFLYRGMTGMAGTATSLTLAKANINSVEAAPKENRSVTFLVKGFTCLTCATGLEVTLLKQNGVARASASYPEGRVVIGFDENQVEEEALRQIVLGCGFSVV
jgi:copper chaperone CopZ